MKKLTNKILWGTAIAILLLTAVVITFATQWEWAHHPESFVTKERNSSGSISLDYEDENGADIHIYRGYQVAGSDDKGAVEVFDTTIEVLTPENEVLTTEN